MTRTRWAVLALLAIVTVFAFAFFIQAPRSIPEPIANAQLATLVVDTTVAPAGEHPTNITDADLAQTTKEIRDGIKQSANTNKTVTINAPRADVNAFYTQLHRWAAQQGTSSRLASYLGRILEFSELVP